MNCYEINLDATTSYEWPSNNIHSIITFGKVEIKFMVYDKPVFVWMIKDESYMIPDNIKYDKVVIISKQTINCTIYLNIKEEI